MKGMLTRMPPVTILMLPLYQVWKLAMPFRQKCIVTMLFLLGALVVAASIARSVIQLELAYAPLGSTETTCKFTSLIVAKPIYANTLSADTDAVAVIWGSVEVCTGVISACLPTLRPLLGQRGPESAIRSVQSKLGKSWNRFKFLDSNATDNSNSNANSSPPSDGYSEIKSVPSSHTNYSQDEMYALHPSKNGIIKTTDVSMYPV